VRRVGNIVVHPLAKFALVSIDYVWIEKNLPCIASVVATDLIHV